MNGDLLSAVIGVVEEAKTARRTVVPIGELEEVYGEEVSIGWSVTEIWTPRIRPSVRLGWSRTKAGERAQVVQQETGTFAEFDGYDGEQTTDVTSEHDARNIDIE